MRRLESLPDAHLRLFERPPLPEIGDIRRIHLIGICGKGMGALAELLVDAGYTVTGSDEAAYPPMSDRLAELGIPVYEGYAARNLDEAVPDLVIVGNAATPTHPEAAAVRERNLPQLSLPEALAEFFLSGKLSVVAAGTHGKTTTAGILAHVLSAGKRDPGFFIGGIMANTNATARRGSDRYFVIEGDEYDSAYFDKRPKFVHYRPHIAIVSSMEFDHADIYDSWEDYQNAFRVFAGLLPSNGLLILNGDDPNCRELAEYSWARTRYVGLENRSDLDLYPANLQAVEGGQEFDVIHRKENLGRLFLPMSGAGNRFNALAVVAAALDAGLSFEEIVTAFASFKGMARRQEIIGEAQDVLIVDDFAHHPTAVTVTLGAIRERWPNRRLVAAFEPRSNSSRRKLFEKPYAEALANADLVFLTAPALRHNDSDDDFLNPETVIAAIREHGIPAEFAESPEALRPIILKNLQAGDLLLTMSNGSFGNLPRLLLEELRK